MVRRSGQYVVLRLADRLSGDSAQASGACTRQVRHELQIHKAGVAVTACRAPTRTGYAVTCTHTSKIGPG